MQGAIKRWQGPLGAFCVAMLVATGALLAPPLAAAQEQPDLFSTVPQDEQPGTEAGRLDNPRGIASDPVTGHFYVGDSSNARISEFTIWGEFVKAWGWGVVASGPGNQPPGGRDEKQEIRVDASSGSFRLRYIIGGEQDSGTIAANATAAEVQAAYEAMPSVEPGDVAVSGPAGGPWTVQFTGDLADTDIRLPRVVSNTLSGDGAAATVHSAQGGSEFEVCVAADGDLCRSGQALASFDDTVSQGGQLTASTAVAVDTARDVYVFEGSAQRVSKFEPTGAFELAFGGDVVATGPNDSAVDEQQKATVKATGGVFKLRVEDPFPGDVNQETALLPFNASAAEVQAKLQALPAIGEADASVTVSGGPGDATGSSPYLIDFEGSLGGDNVPTLQATNGLSGPEASIAVQTVVSGGAPEICKASAGDVCKRGAVGLADGQFSASSFETNLAAGPSGTIYVGDKDRIQAFNPDGSFKAEIPLPEPGTVGSLAADPVSGDLYFTYSQGGKPNVWRLDETTGALLDTLVVEKPGSIAVDSDGNVYAVQLEGGAGGAGAESEVLKFDPSGNCLICAGDDFGEPPPKPGKGRIGLIGLATNSACEVPEDHLHASYFNTGTASFVRSYGPAPQDAGTCPPPEMAPTIEDQYAVAVDSDSATVRAEINPNFWPDTRYYVEYGTGKCSEGGCPNTQPLSPGALLTDKVTKAPLKTAGVLLAGLSPNTAYRYRFVAQSSGGGPLFGVDPDGEEGPVKASFEEGLEATFTTFPLPLPLIADCPNQGFRGGPSSFLPDCRAFELVSPVDKGGTDISVLFNFLNDPAELNQSATDGERLTYSSQRSFGDAAGAPYSSQYLATREAGKEWSTEGISPPQEGHNVLPGVVKFDIAYKAFSADLCQGWLSHETGLLAPGAITGLRNLYRRGNCGAEGYEPITIADPSLKDPGGYFPELQGLSTDGAHAVFRAEGKLTDNASDKVDGSGNPIHQLYEHFEGELRLVSVLPNGVASDGPSSAGTANTIHPPGRANGVADAVSGDGSRIFWTTGTASGAGALYVRVDETPSLTGDEETVAISAGPARFHTAAVDGSTAIYEAAGELREFDLASETSSLIAEDLRGVLGASEDVSRLYFVSEQNLDEGASAGEPNLYLYEAGEPPAYTFVAILSEDDASPATGTGKIPSPVHHEPIKRSSRVSPDGLHLAFMSNAPLTGYDNTDLNNGEADGEVFLYSAPSEELVCLSCNPNGARPSGRNIARFDAYWAAAQIPRWATQLYAPRVLSEDGSRLFFESFEALVPRDSNGKQDVYQWSRAADTVACEAIGAELFVPATGGCLSLITSGQSAQDSEFVDASRDGSDVFFKTGSSLLPHDPGLIDVYDARELGGLPIPVPPKPPCQGEACQSPPPPPERRTPSSSTYSGPGNRTEGAKKPCPKGKRKAKVKGKVRCVPKKRKGKAGKGKPSRRVAR